MNDGWMSKADNVSWHEYLQGYSQIKWREPSDEYRYAELNGLLQPLYAAMIGNVLDKYGPKIVIATSTPLPVQRQGYPPFTFKAQCLVTGRLSRAIPHERFTEFGIFTSDAYDGGSFPRVQVEVKDRMTPVIMDLESQKLDCAPTWEGPGLSWGERYGQYMRSEEWQEKRQAVLRRDKYRCQWTGKSARPGDHLNVHHLTYIRVGCEDLADLITVCRSAHAAHHGRAK